MKILLLSKVPVECELVLNQLCAHGHDVDVVSGGLAAVSALGAHAYDFLVVVDSPDDIYNSKYITCFAEKHRIPSLLMQVDDSEELPNLPREIRPETVAGTGSVVLKCATTMSCVNALVDTSAKYWEKNWELPEAVHAT
jgi:hypothetical protein